MIGMSPLFSSLVGVGASDRMGLKAQAFTTVR